MADSYLAVLKATYDYVATSDDEIGIKEDQVLLLTERVDDDWWKVKPKGDSQDDDQPAGLVPAAYVEQADHTSVVKAIYDYAAAAPGELTIAEDDVLLVFDTDGDWLLVQSKAPDGRAGYVPANYVEPAGDDDAPAAPAVGPIVVPDDPPRPTSTYVDPADRVASAKASADDIETWSVSEVDKKGKKMKGTLGIGNGAVFFASETSKAAVQQWQTANIVHISVEKGKHVHFDVEGPDATSLHFSTGSRDNADAIVNKLESSRALSIPGGAPGATSESALEEEDLEDEAPQRPRDVRTPSVRFQPGSPTIIPPKEDPSDDEEEAEEEAGSGDRIATVLYDFSADGPDELSAKEDEKLVVLEDDDADWWKCRNARNQEGVVPASYLELAAPGKGPATSRAPPAAVEPDDEEDDDSEEREAEERARAEAEAEAKAKAKADRDAKRESERKKAEAERRAKEASDAADARRRQKQKQQEEANKRSTTSSPSQKPEATHSPKPSVDQGKPNPKDVRVWHDRTGQFRVDASFLGFSNGKLRLHKTNGVIVEVPSEKMSSEDMKYVQKAMSRKSRGPPPSSKTSDDDIPIGVQYPNANGNAKRLSQAPPKKPTVDWFEFFLNAGCEIDDCTRYNSSFEREKIDEGLLLDLSEGTLRSLGLREGDIIRVMKAIEKRKPKPDAHSKDEELAKQLHAELNGPSKPAPNLFAGPGGALKTPQRRGRPTPSKSLPPSVDLSTISGGPRTESPSLLSPVQAPPRSSSAVGFDDDAWTNRPSSTKPMTPRAPSAPPLASSQPAPVAAPAPAAAPAAQPAASPPATGTPLANTTESDIFNQLARLSELRKNTPSAPISTPTPPAQVTSPVGFRQGMGMGGSPAPMGQLQSQPTGFQPQQTGFQPQQQQQQYSGARGPFAPVPANQGLLQPLVPTQTGFNSFVPTRPASGMNTSPFANPAPGPTPSFLNSQPTGFQPSFLASQPTGFQPSQPSFQTAQPTGFQPSQPSFQPSQPTGFQSGFGGQQSGFGGGQQPMMAQATGFPGQQQQPMMAQATGMPFGGMNGGGLMSQPTGMPNNNGFGNYGTSTPPVPPLPNNSTNAANIFAQMKSGTFAKDDAPQNANKYDALRPNPMQPQATGWGGYNGGGGYGYQQ